MPDDSASLALSDLEDMKVVDVNGAECGELLDVVAVCSAEACSVTGFLLESGREQLRASWDQVAEIDVDGERLRLCVPGEDLAPAWLRSNELELVDSVLDNQVLDMRRRTFVRVQDVLLESAKGELVVAGVDTSSGALARRFGLRFLSRRLSTSGGSFLPWEDVNLISLRISRLNFVEAFAELAELHPADIADIVGQVGPTQRAAVLAALNAGLAADTLQEMKEELRTAALQEMPVARAAAVLEQTDADDAADILAELPDGLAQEILGLLPAERERDLRDLASHAEHTAGSLMTTDFVTLSPGVNAGDALAWLRRERSARQIMNYLYVLDGEGCLVGVVSLRDLVLAEPSSEVAGLMEDDVVSVAVDTDEREAGRLMIKYDLLALPVVDAQQRPLGIVTIDDALDAVLPDDWKQRLPRLIR